MTFAQLKKNIRKAKRVSIEVSLTSHDPFIVQVKKNDLLWVIQNQIEPNYKDSVRRGEAEIQTRWFDNNQDFLFYGVFDV